MLTELLGKEKNGNWEIPVKRLEAYMVIPIRDDCYDHSQPTWIQRIQVEDTKGLRHRSRILGTLCALIEVFVEPTNGFYKVTRETLEELQALVKIDLHGVGGPHGWQGESTQRMSWANGLGKARWHASDGAAYRAASKELLVWLEDRTGKMTTEWMVLESIPVLSSKVSVEDQEFLWAYLAHTIAKEGLELSPKTLQLATDAHKALMESCEVPEWGLKIF